MAARFGGSVCAPRWPGRATAKPVCDARRRRERAMPATPHLHLEGHRVATAEVVDTYRHDRDECHQLFLFPSTTKSMAPRARS